MNIFRGNAAHDSYADSQAVAKIAFLVSVFEKLVADVGERRARIEQMLTELCEERTDVKPLSTTAAPPAESVKRAA